MTNIYVGNLPYDATEDQLKELFSAHGTVERVNIITDRMTGRARGFAFVEMPDQAAAEAAIAALNESTFGDRTLNVNVARPKTERGGGGGGGRRGGRYGR